jgi:hypothetical protein
MKTKLFFTTIIVAVLTLALAACGAGATPTSAPATQMPEQSMTISDQSVSAGIITIDELVIVRPSWVVIHPDNNGSPNNKTNVGRIALPTGRHENVEITLDLARVTPLLYAEIHDDLGAPGEFEALDRPAKPSVLVTFNVTLPVLATSAGDIAGIWKRLGAGADAFLQFEAEGIMTYARGKPENLQSQPFAVNEFTFQGTQLLVKEGTSVLADEACVNATGIYETQLLDNGNLRLIVIEDACQRRVTGLATEWTRLQVP